MHNRRQRHAGASRQTEEERAEQRQELHQRLAEARERRVELGNRIVALGRERRADPQQDLQQRLTETRIRRAELEQQRQRLETRSLALQHAREQREQIAIQPNPQNRQQGAVNLPAQLAQVPPEAQAPPPNRMLADVAQRGRLALQQADNLLLRMIPVLPSQLRDLLQARIQRVQQAAAVLVEGLNHPNESLSEDTQVSYWAVADDIDEVTSRQ